MYHYTWLYRLDLDRLAQQCMAHACAPPSQLAWQSLAEAEAETLLDVTAADFKSVQEGAAIER